jgi:REP element-mobilizing transposase RayT
MPRPPRRDEPGAWHHVFNRATAKRPLFLSREDYRYFLACTANAARSGTIELHKFILMINHFHMLVRSPKGRLGSAMHDIQMQHARRINRRLGRDGSIFRTRYGSRRVTTDAYRHALVSYIDSNPVAAGVVARPEEFPWSSAMLYARDRRPRWLATDWIDETVLSRTGRDARDMAAYREVFPIRCDPGFLAWVERRLRSPSSARDDLDVVLGPDPATTLHWMRRCAELADGEESALPVADASAILHAIEAARPRAAKLDWRRGPARGPAADTVGRLRAGLLRDAGRLTWAEIAQRTGSTAGTARNHWLAHRQTVLADAVYAELATAIVRAAASSTVGRTAPPLRQRASSRGAWHREGRKRPGIVVFATYFAETNPVPSGYFRFFGLALAFFFGFFRAAAFGFAFPRTYRPSTKGCQLAPSGETSIRNSCTPGATNR